MRRDLLLGALIGLVALASVPAYDRVLDATTWRPPVLLAAAAGVLVAVLARWARLPAILAAPVSAGLLLGALPSLLGLGTRWRDGLTAPWEALTGLADEGLAAVAEQVAPTAPEPGLVLLLVVGWWAIAYLATEVVLRAHRVGPAMVLLVALWTVPLAIETSVAPAWIQVVPWLVAAGALGLAHVHAGPPGAVTLPLSGMVLLATAIAAGVAAPGLLPGYQSDAWLTAGPSDTPRGYQPIVDVSTRLRSPQERDVLRVRASQPVYLRLAGLDTFDGNTWRIGPAGVGVFRPDPARLFPADRPLPPEEPARRTRSVEVDVEVLALENIYVPLPYQPVEVLGPIRSEMVWSTEGGFLASYDRGDLLRDPTVGLTSGAAYRVLAEQPDPRVEDLRSVTVQPQLLAANTALPRDYDALGAQAQEVYATAQATTTIDRVLALQDWFVGPEGGFTYDLDVPALRGEDALTRFVLEDRVGYCEYFATAMAVMLRQTGIPARVAVGFLPGERVATADPDGGEPLDTYLVTSADAHAWVEVLFPGYGWLTFEPTPRSDGAGLVPRTDELAPLTSEAERTDAAAEEPDVVEVPPDADAPATDLPDAADGGDDPADESAPAAGMGAGRIVLSLTVLALLAAILAWAPLHRRHRDNVLADDPRTAVIDAQRHLYRTATRLGQARSPQETAPEVLTRWEQAGQVPAGTAGIAGTVQAAAFDGEVTRSQAAAAVTSLERATAQLVQEASTGDVLRARLERVRQRARAARRRATAWWRER